MSAASSRRPNLSPLRTDILSSDSSALVSPSYSDVSPTTIPDSLPSLRRCKKASEAEAPVIRQQQPARRRRQQQQQGQETEEEGKKMQATRERTRRHSTRVEVEEEEEERGHFPVRPHTDIPPTVTVTPSPTSSSSSVNTYDSSLSLDEYEEGDEVFDPSSSEASSTSRHRLFSFLNTAAADDDAAIPAALPVYRRASVSGGPGGDPNSCFLRASTPHAFGRLFPSLDRLSVRHDDLTPDGNMNLRVDTPLIPGGRRPVQFQLFHLRMHDLARREFSLRRYCRDSGREVCNSKREYALPSHAQRSVTSAIRSVKSPFKNHHHHHSTTSSIFGNGKNRRQSAGSNGTNASTDSHGAGGVSWWDAAGTDGSRPRGARRHSAVSTTGSVSLSSGSSGSAHPPTSSHHAYRPVPTNTIKLEFSNYARVDVVRRGAKGHYDFEWWGHKYTWRRVVDKDLGGVAAFHLVRDGATASPVAHVVPEVRSPTQIEADEEAGGWVPPCYLWISDQSIIDAVTDVADVIVATGLIALVDDSIKERWPGKKPAAARRNSVKFNTNNFNNHHNHESNNDSKNTAGNASVNAHDGNKLLHPRAFINNIFHRRHSEQYTSSPLRAVAAG